jgi:predicted HTH transcriptional regulator
MIVDRKIPLPDLMKEHETLEFKKSLAELKAGLISIVAMLNKHGAGELWFGVRNDGKAVGLDAGEKMRRMQSFGRLLRSLSPALIDRPLWSRTIKPRRKLKERLKERPKHC